MKPWPQLVEETLAGLETRSGRGSLPVVELSPAEVEYARQLHKAKVRKMELRWCDDGAGFFFRRTRGLSARPDYTQIFKSSWEANRAAATGGLVWSDVEPNEIRG